MIQNDINLEIVNIVVGYTPKRPAKLLMSKILQIAGQFATEEGDHGSINRQ